MEQLLIERVAVLERAVIEELLAVIGGDDHQAALEHLPRGEAIEQARDLRRDERDLLVVDAAQERAIGGVELD